jgi:hypothetical protein
MNDARRFLLNCLLNRELIPQLIENVQVAAAAGNVALLDHWLAISGYEMNSEELSHGLEVFLANELSAWSGIYRIASSAQHSEFVKCGSSLVITPEGGVFFDYERLDDAVLSGGILTWTANSQDIEGRLTLSFPSSPDRVSCAAPIFTGMVRRPGLQEELIKGELAPLQTFPLAYWSGCYDLLSPGEGDGQRWIGSLLVVHNEIALSGVAAKSLIYDSVNNRVSWNFADADTGGIMQFLHSAELHTNNSLGGAACVGSLRLSGNRTSFRVVGKRSGPNFSGVWIGDYGDTVTWSAAGHCSPGPTLVIKAPEDILLNDIPLQDCRVRDGMLAWDANRNQSAGSVRFEFQNHHRDDVNYVGPAFSGWIKDKTDTEAQEYRGRVGSLTVGEFQRRRIEERVHAVQLLRVIVEIITRLCASMKVPVAMWHSALRIRRELPGAYPGLRFAVRH